MSLLAKLVVGGRFAERVIVAMGKSSLYEFAVREGLRASAGK